MAHLSTIENPWGKAFTNKRYIHPPLAENIVIAWPTSMVTIGELTAANNLHEKVDGDWPQGWGKSEHFNGFVGALPTAGVIFTLKRESNLLFRQRDAARYQNYKWEHEFMPYKKTQYKTRKDGVPIHALVKDFDAVKFHQETFCDSARVSTAYIKVTVENGFGLEQTVELGTLVRTGPEFLFTGCVDPDGYGEYEPSRERWNEKEMTRYEKKKGYLTDGVYKLYFNEKEAYEFGGENDLNIVLHLKPYEKRTFTFAFTRNANKPKAYATARRETEAFWKKELSKAQNVPDKKGVEPMFYNFLAQELQMFAMPQGKNYVIIRQGATQRYYWPEAKEIVRALSLIGGYSDYIDAGLAHYFGELQEKEGENAGRIFYAYVPWNSWTAAALEMFADAVAGDDSFYDKYIERAMLGFDWMERERAKSANIEGVMAGLFPPGIATDNHFPDAQQWTFADTSMLFGYEALLGCLKAKNSPHLAKVQAAYDDYFGIMKGIFDKFAEEQKDSEFLYLPRDPKNRPDLEAGLNKDYFMYMFPNPTLASGVAGYGTKEAEKLIYTYSHGGQSRNGLVYPVYRSTTGVGRVWYTSWGERDRFRYYNKSGNREKCKEILDAQLKYNVTTEYYQPERYDDHDAYCAPWLPNASANGRLLDMLFTYYGSKKLN